MKFFPCVGYISLRKYKERFAQAHSHKRIERERERERERKEGEKVRDRGGGEGYIRWVLEYEARKDSMVI